MCSTDFRCAVIMDIPYICPSRIFTRNKAIPVRFNPFSPVPSRVKQIRIIFIVLPPHSSGVIFFCPLQGEIQPFFYFFVILLQNILIAITQVHPPWNQVNGIAPSCGTIKQMPFPGRSSLADTAAIPFNRP